MNTVSNGKKQNENNDLYMEPIHGKKYRTRFT